MSLEDYPHPGDLGWRLPDNLRELKWIIIITQKNDSLKLHSSPLSAITTSYYSALLTGIFSINQVKNVNYFSFFCPSIPKGDKNTKKTTPNTEVCPKSIGAMLEYWYIICVLFTSSGHTWQTPYTFMLFVQWLHWF